MKELFIRGGGYPFVRPHVRLCVPVCPFGAASKSVTPSPSTASPRVCVCVRECVNLWLEASST